MMYPVCLGPVPISCWQQQESDDDTATTAHMTDAAAAAAGAKTDKRAAPRVALDAMLAGEAAINPQVRTTASSQMNFCWLTFGGVRYHHRYETRGSRRWVFLRRICRDEDLPLVCGLVRLFRVLCQT